jgi:hypothetical protein
VEIKHTLSFLSVNGLTESQEDSGRRVFDSDSTGIPVYLVLGILMEVVTNIAT